MASGKEIKIICGNSIVSFAEGICRCLGLRLSLTDVTTFSDGEISVTLHESVRGSHVFIVQSMSSPVNDYLMEMLIMIDACKRASASQITAVIPYFGYARQDRKAKARDPISAKLIANLITSAGADRVLTMDLHEPQTQGFFDIPVDNLLGIPLFVEYYRKKFNGSMDDVVVVSPVISATSRARAFAMQMGLGLAVFDRRRAKESQTEIVNIMGSVEGKRVILFDDMVDTADSMHVVAKVLTEMCKTKEVLACASHGVLSGRAIERVNESYLTELVFTDTIPYGGIRYCSKIKYLKAAPLFAKAIKNIFEEVSISHLFHYEYYNP